MEERGRIGPWARVLDDDGGRGGEFGRVETAEIGGGDDGRAGMIGEDAGEMALSRALRADHHDDVAGPIGPALDQRRRGGIGVSNDPVVATATFDDREIERQLTGLGRHAFVGAPGASSGSPRWSGLARYCSRARSGRERRPRPRPAPPPAHADEAERGDAEARREEQPDRMEADRAADPVRRQDPALLEPLPDREDREHEEQSVPVGPELHERHDQAGDEAGTEAE